MAAACMSKMRRAAGRASCCACRQCRMPAAPRPEDGPDMAKMMRELPDEASTILFGQDIAMALRPGDVVALSGDLGAGKSTLARALLRALAADPALEVPSPTYTLCQRYELVFA